ncbi:VWA domain-containing protein [Bordetella sp. BOR01]|uniref:vWA domain-containing protein n=1 Tax=Bordetella sp. BOR01 TaxID=2854779 RepID=UPI001C455034|nr:VWA domain-containing protein [Bordetella sp. BOR01]MBV7486772.1 VWA domain-containing protein [Bordetella sp. BOR01]
MNPKNAPARLICTALAAALLAACSPPPQDGHADATKAAPMAGAAATPPAPVPPAAEAQAKADAGAPLTRPAPAMRPEYAPQAYVAQRASTPRLQAPAGYYPAPQIEDRENYARYRDNPVVAAQEQSVSTFGVDVDTGSYTNVRRLLNEGRLPPADAVRAEEFINYFDYDYATPASRAQPFSIATEIAAAPWNSKRQLLKIGIQGYQVAPQDIPAANLVFLIDTSGSMADRDKLPLLKGALKQLVAKLRPQDRVAIVTYAGQATMTLDSTPGDQKARINAAIDGLSAAGSTNGGAGLDLAYAQAAKGFVKDGVNRILLASDGDFNVGATDLDALKDKIARQRQSGIALTTLGVGGGNFNDALAMQLADVGNGSYHYLDGLREARKVLSGELSATLLTIARDVKIQVEFNPALVAEYRLIGYEKRALAREDFNNDRVDAGEIGAGANVTALYEITPVGAAGTRLDPLRYGKPAAATGPGEELAFVRVRYKLPGATDSQLIEQPVARAGQAEASDGMRRAAAAAAFAQWLRGGKYLDGYTPAQIAALARSARGQDPHGLNAELAALAELAADLGTPAVP